MWSFDASVFFAKDTTVGIHEVSVSHQFIVYPNPLQQDQSISVSTSESGEIYFYDALGRLVGEQQLQSGINQIKLDNPSGVVFYKAALQSGMTKNGKIVTLK